MSRGPVLPQHCLAGAVGRQGRACSEPTACPVPQHPAPFALTSSCLTSNVVLMHSAEILSKYCGTGLLSEGKSEPEINQFYSEKTPIRMFSLFQCHISCHATLAASDYYLHWFCFLYVC